MATIVVSPLPVRGHVNPSLKLVRELGERGHRVVIASLLDAQALLPPSVEFEPVLPEAAPRGTLFQESAAGAPPTPPREQRRQVTRMLRAVAEGGLDPLFEKLRPDLVMGDVMLPFLTLAAYGHRVPALMLNTALPQEFSGPGPTGSPAARWLRSRASRAAVAVFTSLGLVPPFESSLRKMARRYGYPLEKMGRLPEHPLPTVPELILCPQEFLQPHPCAQNPRYHFTGPGIETTRAEEDFPWHRLQEDKPLVLVALGSMGEYRRPLEDALLQAAAGVAAQRPDWQFVLATGTGRDPAAYEKTPNVIAQPFVPQLALLSRAATMVTHAGLNSVKECIFYGVPMVALPLAYDQPANAGQLERHHLGLVLPADRHRTTAETVRAALEQVLGDPSYRQAMEAMRAHFRRAEEERPAHAVIERFLAAQ